MVKWQIFAILNASSAISWISTKLLSHMMFFCQQSHHLSSTHTISYLSISFFLMVLFRFYLNFFFSIFLAHALCPSFVSSLLVAVRWCFFLQFFLFHLCLFFDFLCILSSFSLWSLVYFFSIHSLRNWSFCYRHVKFLVF